VSSFGLRPHLSRAAGVRIVWRRVNDCEPAASKGLQRPNMVNASDHEGRIARSGMVSRLRRLSAGGGVEIKLCRRPTVFEVPILRRCAWRQPGARRLRSKTSLADNGQKAYRRHRPNKRVSRESVSDAEPGGFGNQRPTCGMQSGALYGRPYREGPGGDSQEPVLNDNVYYHS
jgi:hypothetical protein